MEWAFSLPISSSGKIRRELSIIKTSASSIQTAVVTPFGSTGVTAFNGWDGRNAARTATPALYSALYMTSDDWGIMEYNPSVPYANNVAPNGDPQYYASELRNLWNFGPHVIAPFAGRT